MKKLEKNKCMIYLGLYYYLLLIRKNRSKENKINIFWKLIVFLKIIIEN